MREVKFRAWDKTESRMFVLHGHHDSLWFPPTGIAQYMNMQNGSGGDEYELMQYTGLEDKNGVEMYEGDIVNFSFRMGRNEPQHFEGVLVEVDPIWGSTVSADDTYSLGRCHDIEVIGNIYENKELLS